MSERPHHKEDTQMNETLQDFRDRMAIHDAAVTAAMALFVDYLLSKPKNKKILKDVHEAQEEQTSRRYGAT